MQTHRASLLHHTLPLRMTSAFAVPVGLLTSFLRWDTANFKLAPITLNKKPRHVFSFQSGRKREKYKAIY